MRAIVFYLYLCVLLLSFGYNAQAHNLSSYSTKPFSQKLEGAHAANFSSKAEFLFLFEDTDVEEDNLQQHKTDKVKKNCPLSATTNLQANWPLDCTESIALSIKVKNSTAPYFLQNKSNFFCIQNCVFRI